MKIGFIISLIYAGIVGLFALNNGGKVTVDLIFKDIEISLAIVIFISAFSGAIIAAILGWIKDFKYKKEVKELIKEKVKINKEKELLEEKLKSKDEQITSIYELRSDLAKEDKKEDNIN